MGCCALKGKRNYGFSPDEDGVDMNLDDDTHQDDAEVRKVTEKFKV